ncbi:MAG: methyltransferase domain-containing protein [Planctomycetota bacterium]
MSLDQKDIFGTRSSLERLVRHAALQAGQTVLDVGTGTGAAAFELWRAGGHVVAVDVSRPTWVDAEPGPAFACADAARLPFASGSFARVVARRVGHHLLDLEAGLSEMVRVLAPGGRLIIDDRIVSQEQRSLVDELERLRDASHVQCLTEDEWRERIEELGLIDVRCEAYARRIPCGAYFPCASSDSRIARRLAELGPEDRHLLEIDEASSRLTQRFSVLSGRRA